MKRARRFASVTLQWLVASVIAIATWALLTPHVSRLFLVSPALVWDQISDWYKTGLLWNMVGTTSEEAGLGLAIGASFGILLALIVGLGPSIFGKVVEPVVVAIYASPKFVLIPLLVVWIGTGLYPRVSLIAVSLFANIFVTTITGMRTVDRDQLDMMGMLGADRRQVARKLVIPHTMGYISTGLTLAATHAVTIAIGAEILFGSSTGIGGEMNYESQFFNTKAVLSGLVLATVIASIAISIGRSLNVRAVHASGRIAKT